MKIHNHGIKQENEVNAISSTISLSLALEKETHFRLSVQPLSFHRMYTMPELKFNVTQMSLKTTGCGKVLTELTNHTGYYFQYL